MAAQTRYCARGGCQWASRLDAISEGSPYGPHEGHVLPIRDDEERQEDAARAPGPGYEVGRNRLQVDVQQ